MTVATPFQSLWAKAGFKAETPIQAAVAEPLRADRDVVGLAPTGSGKTLAFGLPLLEKVVPGDGIQIIILSPSQELAVQTRDVLQPYAQVIGVHVTAITGSANVARQKEQLKKHPEVVVATVGRLLELADDGVAKLHNLETMVVDEADELLRDPGLGQVRDLLQHAPGELQLAFFSATDGPVLHELHKWFGVERKWSMCVRWTIPRVRSTITSCVVAGNTRWRGWAVWRTRRASRHLFSSIRTPAWNARPVFCVTSGLSLPCCRVMPGRRSASRPWWGSAKAKLSCYWRLIWLVAGWT